MITIISIVILIIAFVVLNLANCRAPKVMSDVELKSIGMTAKEILKEQRQQRKEQRDYNRVRNSNLRVAKSLANLTRKLLK